MEKTITITIVTGEFEIAERDVPAAKDAMKDMMAESAKEEGFLHYRFYQDVEYPEWLHVYEEWESDDHLAAHAASKHMAVFRERMGTLEVKTRYVRKTHAEPGTLL